MSETSRSFDATKNLSLKDSTSKDPSVKGSANQENLGTQEVVMEEKQV